MIDDKILDEIFPVQDLTELKAKTVSELKEEGFVITNFQTGGIFNTLLMIVLQARVELTKLLRKLLSYLYVRHAPGKWLDLLGEDFSKSRKAAKNTCGNVTIYRDNEVEAKTLVIPINTIFKTNKDINHEELRFFSSKAVEMLAEDMSISIPVTAEKAGSIYNLPEGQINKCMIHLEGIDRITNEQDWITSEGADEEEEEAFRERIINSWAELSSRPIALKYKNVCEAVKGVLHVRVDDLHPRGQGTIDIIVTSTAGQATESLLEDVRAAADKIKGEYDNLLVKSAITVPQDLSLIITLPRLASDEGIVERVNAIVIDYFKISRNRNLNEIILFDLSYALKKGIEIIKNVKFTAPTDDVVLDKDQVILLGRVEITVEREE
ncbi:baseplate J/gp47 family protein [Eisenbergiella porci]|uniref:baseplate J/gp47 family protein n=1 Tax=Eisenbergiella porci TaxID=2652274 RepID=UPI002A7FD3B1|nr:baseplate J/gp47 family protein [Eisenbergiella porci]